MLETTTESWSGARGSEGFGPTVDSLPAVASENWPVDVLLIEIPPDISGVTGIAGGF